MSTPHIITLELPKLPSNAKLSAIALQSARNLISLFADHEEEIQDAITKSEEAKTTFGHSIILDLGKQKQIDRLSFSIKRGDEITMSIPDPDQPDMFEGMNWEEIRKARAASKTVDAEIVPLGLPAPMEMIDELPAEKTCMEDDENLTDRVPDADEEE